MHLHKAGIELAFWQYWAANSRSINIHPHKAETEPAFWQYWAADMVLYVNVWAGTQLLGVGCEAHVGLQNSFIKFNQKHDFLARKQPQKANIAVQILRL